MELCRFHKTVSSAFARICLSINFNNMTYVTIDLRWSLTYGWCKMVLPKDIQLSSIWKVPHCPIWLESAWLRWKSSCSTFRYLHDHHFALAKNSHRIDCRKRCRCDCVACISSIRSRLWTKCWLWCVHLWRKNWWTSCICIRRWIHSSINMCR